MNANNNVFDNGSSLLKNHLRFNANINAATVQKVEIYNASNGIDRRPADLVRRFGDLYSMARLDTLDALDNVRELDQLIPSPLSSNTSSTSSIHSSSSIDRITRSKSTSEELKNKLLFSVVVVSLTLSPKLLSIFFPSIVLTSFKIKTIND